MQPCPAALQLDAQPTMASIPLPHRSWPQPHAASFCCGHLLGLSRRCSLQCLALHIKQQLGEAPAALQAGSILGVQGLVCSQPAPAWGSQWAVSLP